MFDEILKAHPKNLTPVELAERCLAYMIVENPAYIDDYRALIRMPILKQLAWGALLHHFAAKNLSSILAGGDLEPELQKWYETLIRNAMTAAPFLAENRILQARLLLLEAPIVLNAKDKKSLEDKTRLALVEARALNPNVTIPMNSSIC